MIKEGTYINERKKGDLVPCSGAAGEIEEIGDDVKMIKKGMCRTMSASKYEVNYFRATEIVQCLIRHFYGDITPANMNTGLDRQVDGVLQEYRIVPGNIPCDLR